MSEFSAQLKAAKATPRRTRVVGVLLDAGLADDREKLLEKLDRAKALPSDDRLTGESEQQKLIKEIQAELDDLVLRAADSIVKFQFTRLPGDVWAEITARCPARIEAPIDRQYGYNVHAVCRLAAPRCGLLMVGDDKFSPLTVTPATEEAPAVDEWADLFNTISGHEFGLIMDAIFDLNEFEPAGRVADLKKALATRPA